MKRHLLFEKLIRTARHQPPGDQVPYAFEKRVMAQLVPANRDVNDDWAAIARGLWCSAAACCLVAIASSVWAFSSEPARDAAGSFSSDLEQTILASLDDFKLESDYDIWEGEVEILQ